MRAMLGGLVVAGLVACGGDGAAPGDGEPSSSGGAPSSSGGEGAGGEGADGGAASGGAASGGAAAPAGEPYAHVVPADIGVTVGAGSVAPLPMAAYTGPQEITEDDTVIENVVIDTCLRITASNVTLRNVIVNCDGIYPIRYSDGADALLVENSHLACGSNSKVVYITGDATNATFRNNELTGCEDFFFVGGEVGELLVEGNVMHRLNLTSESHADGFQIGEAERTTGTIRVVGNYIDPEADGGKTDVIFATNKTAATVIVESNYIHQWGLRTIRCVTDEVRCEVRYNVFDEAFKTVQQSGGKLVFLQASEEISPVFECNVYPDGSFVVEDDVVDRVWGTTHVTDGCPPLPN